MHLTVEHVAYASYECTKILSLTEDELVNKMEGIGYGEKGREKKGYEIFNKSQGDSVEIFTTMSSCSSSSSIPHSNSFFIEFSIQSGSSC